MHALAPPPPPDDELERRRRAQRLEDALRWIGGLDELRAEREFFADDPEAAKLLDAKIAHVTTELRREALNDAKVLLPAEDLDAIASNKVIDTESVTSVRRFVAKLPRRMLWLVGDPGPGKSFGAAYGIAEYGEGTWTRGARLERTIFPGFGEKPPELHSGLAVLDDLGSGIGGDRFDAALAEWVEERLARSAPTIVTSNSSAADLRNRLDARLLDRLRHHAVVVEITGPSLRRQDGGL